MSAGWIFVASLSSTCCMFLAALPTMSCSRRKLIVRVVRGARHLRENCPEHSFGPGSLSTFFAYRLASFAEAVNHKKFLSYLVGINCFLLPDEADLNKTSCMIGRKVVFCQIFVKLLSLVSRFSFTASGKHPSLYAYNVDREPGPNECYG